MNKIIVVIAIDNLIESPNQKVWHLNFQKFIDIQRLNFILEFIKDKFKRMYSYLNNRTDHVSLEGIACKNWNALFFMHIDVAIILYLLFQRTSEATLKNVIIKKCYDP